MKGSIRIIRSNCLALNSVAESEIQVMLKPWQAWCLGHFPGSLGQWPTTLSEKNLFLVSSLSFPQCSLILFPHVLLLAIRGGSAPPPPLEEGVGCDEGTPQPSFLRTQLSQVSSAAPQRFCPGDLLQFWSHRWLQSTVTVWCPSCTEGPQTAPVLKAPPVQCRVDNQLAMLCWMYPRLWLVLLAARAPCWLISSYSPSAMHAIHVAEYPL